MTECLVHVDAGSVARGVARFFYHRGQRVLFEVPLPNGRRADLLSVDSRGAITIVEIKVALADLRGDVKWPDYLDWCDQFYWALSPDIDPAMLPAAHAERCGLLVGDRYGAQLLREGQLCPLSPSRRRSELLRIGRLAMQRVMTAIDPDLATEAIESSLP